MIREAVVVCSVNSRLNSGKLVEPKTNTIASEYAAKNWHSLVNGAIKFGASPDKAEDLVQDMLLNLLVAEREGDCFDSTKGNTYDDIGVENMVWGRVKLYAKNKKYHKHSVKNKGQDDYIEIPSCSDFNGDNSDGLNSAQYSYATAGAEDMGLDEVEDLMSIKTDIEKIMCGPVILRNIIKNLEYFSENQDKIDLRGILGGFKLKNSEYAESLVNIIKLYSIKPDYVDSLVNAMQA